MDSVKKKNRMEQFDLENHQIMEEFTKQNAFRHFGFTDVDIKKMKMEMTDESHQLITDWPNALVPCSFLVNKRKHMTTKLLLKYIHESLKNLGYEVVCDGFRKLTDIHVFDNKIKKCDIVLNPVLKRLLLLNNFDFNAGSNWDNSCGLAVLWFCLLKINYLTDMDGIENPYLYCKDLTVNGQPIVIRRCGKQIHFTMICVWTPKPEDLSNEFINSLAMFK